MERKHETVDLNLMNCDWKYEVSWARGVFKIHSESGKASETQISDFESRITDQTMSLRLLIFASFYEYLYARNIK